MKIEFIKDCSNGIKKGTVKVLPNNIANAIIAKGRAKEVKATRAKKKKEEDK